MANFYVQDKSLSKGFWGNTALASIWCGDTKVWPTSIAGDIVMPINVASANKQVCLGFGTGRQLTIDWGDGTVETINTTTIETPATNHTYTAAGKYTIIVNNDESVSSTLTWVGIFYKDTSSSKTEEYDLPIYTGCTLTGQVQCSNEIKITGHDTNPYYFQDYLNNTTFSSISSQTGSTTGIKDPEWDCRIITSVPSSPVYFTIEDGATLTAYQGACLEMYDGYYLKFKGNVTFNSSSSRTYSYFYSGNGNTVLNLIFDFDDTFTWTNSGDLALFAEGSGASTTNTFNIWTDNANVYNSFRNATFSYITAGTFKHLDGTDW